MPYCPKCGVEVDDYVKKCPLCEFPIPDVMESEDKSKKGLNYPIAENIYREELVKRKNRVFYFLLILELVIVVVLLLIKTMYKYRLLDYFILSILCIIFYMFFFFGYLRLKYNVIGISFTTIVFTYFLSDFIQNDIWFIEYALPIILLSTLDTFLNLYLYKINRSKNKFVYVPVFILLFITILCLGIDALIFYRGKGVFNISWSLIVCAVNIPIILVMLITYHKISERTIEIFKKRFHI